MRSTVAAVLLLLFCFGAPLTAHAGQPADTLFVRGEKLLSQARWNAADSIFTDLTTRFATSPDVELYLLDRGKAEYYGGNSSKALSTFEEFITRFGDSPYRPFALYFSANAAYKLNQRDRALGRYIEAYSANRDQRLDELIVSSLSAYDESKLENKITALTQIQLSSRRKCDLTKALAEKFARTGRSNDAERLRALCGGSRTIAPSIPGKTIGETFQVAVLVPLSGEYQVFGQDLFDGAATAATMYRKETGKQITLTPYDTKGDPVLAARIVRQLGDFSVDAMIGPLTSDEAEVTSAALSCHTIPMITPAATESGLTQLSDCSFQLSPNIELEGVQMAEYARKTLQADSAVVISSTNTDQLEMVKAFVDRFQNLGGKIVATEYYRSRDRDYGDYIRDIKSILLGHTADSATYLDDKGDTLAAEAVPAQVDCIYMPGTPEQIRLLLPQIRFYNLNGAFLGSDGWGDESVYSLGEDVTKGAVFPSPFVRTVRAPEYARFAAGFEATYDRKPSRVAGLGYDAMKVVLDALKRGATNRQQLLEQIAQTSGYDGAEGRVSFGAQRENIEMPVYKIQGGEPVLIGVNRLSSR